MVVIFYFLDTCFALVPDVISVFSVSCIGHLLSLQMCQQMCSDIANPLLLHRLLLYTELAWDEI